MLRNCAPGEEIKISIPKDIEERYNNLLTGIYRIVIKGTENDYIVSDCFEKGERFQVDNPSLISPHIL